MKIEKRLIDLIDKSHEDRTEKPRQHLGASIIGHHCERYLWLNFRWAVQEKFSGRMLRLFRRGHHEEKWVLDDLRATGLTVRDIDPKTGEQYRINGVDLGISPHFGGSLDGIIETTKLQVLEIKTHSDKSFKDLVKEGVTKSKPHHYSQMQMYMAATKIGEALYVAVNKNDDSLYIESVDFNEAHAAKMIARADRIINDHRIPPPISNKPTWYQCKWCPAYSFCHEGESIEARNCRTCINANPTNDGAWHCSHWRTDIPASAQYAGCENWELNGELVG